MSKALKCDRCHNYYEPYYTKIKVLGEGKNIPEDLCPGCSEMLDKWLHEYEYFESVNEEGSR